MILYCLTVVKQFRGRFIKRGKFKLQYYKAACCERNKKGFSNLRQTWIQVLSVTMYYVTLVEFSIFLKLTYLQVKLE